MKKSLLIIFVLFFVIQINAQDNSYIFINYTRENNLIHNQILSLLRDKNGFLWIGTKAGLSRFDGHSFVNFTNNAKDPVSIKENNITRLFEDHQGKIWIAAGNYFDVFDPVTETFVHQPSIFNHRLAVPFQSKWFAKLDADKNIVYANNKNGIYKYITTQDKLIPIHFPTGQKDKEITYFDFDQHGNIWVACNNGYLYKLDKQTFQLTDSLQILSGNGSNLQFYFDKSGNLWAYNIGTPTGIYFKKNNTQQILNFSTQSADSRRLNNNIITGITEDAAGNIWISTDHGGINIIGKNTSPVQYIMHDPFKKQSLCDNSVTTIYKDFEGIIWLGSFKHGFSYYHENIYTFKKYEIPPDKLISDGYNDINNFAEDKKENLWIGTNGGGLVYFNRHRNTFQRYLHDPSNPKSISSNIIVGMIVDKKGRLWAGTYQGGLNLYTGSGFEHFRYNPNDPLSISDDRIWDICEDSDGKFWIGTLFGGITLFDPDSKKAIRYFKFSSGSDSTIQSNLVFEIIEDRDKIMWFATVNGLRSYDRMNNKWEYYNHNPNTSNCLSNNTVNDVFEDSRGLIWVATIDGLNIYNKTTKNFTILKQEDGLPSGSISTITEDNQQTIWLSTPNGLSNIILQKNQVGKPLSFVFKNYDRYDGLQDNEFNDKSAFKTKKGELVFGGPNGFNLFDPGKIHTDNSQSKTLFTEFQLFNKKVQPGIQINKRIILKQSITYTKKIILKFRENVFTISFSSLNFFPSENRKYKYTLENFNTQWFETTNNDPQVTYTNLSPGEYKFRVKASNKNGTWGNEATITIEVLSPWWGTLLFKIAVILFISIFLLVIYFVRIYTLREDKKKLEQSVNDRTLELSNTNILLEQKKEEITKQNLELEQHRNSLEDLVKLRTLELETAMKKVEESGRLKSAFLANMSHEIRTPMNAISGFASLLKNTDLLETDKQEFIDIINQNCDSLLVLINDILDLSKIEANQVSIYKAPFETEPILVELENLYKLNNKKNLEIIYNKPLNGEPIVLNNDKVRFRQIISNLLTNAYKFTEQGHIKFGYLLNKDEIQFFVADTGKGIEENEQDKIFDHFYKIEDINTQFNRGSGLGLPISKKLAEIMGGRMWLESQINEGSTFYFTLPYQPSVKKIESKTLTVIKHLNLNNYTVLVAEDEPANYFLIEQILKPANATIIWAKNGKEAVDFIKELPMHDNIIVLMDIKMPVMNGFDALKNIRLINKNIPVIAVTAYAYESDRNEIVQNNFNGFITKPLKPDMLLNLIGKFVQ